MSDYLTLEDLVKLYLATLDARSKWRNILLVLEISSDTIETIGKQLNNNPEDCYREGLKEWLKGGERSWKDVVKALSSPIVGYSDLAGAIERDHVQSTEKMSDYLTPSDLGKLYIATFAARAKWRNILQIFDVSRDRIETISTKWHDDPDDCYREGLSEWLKGGKRSWKDVMEALSNPSVGHSDIARTIEKDRLQSTTPNDVETLAIDQTCQRINKDLVIFVDERLGSGAFGVVFKGKYKDEICAVKVSIYEAIEMQINMSVGKNEEASKRFDREGEFLESLQHPNVVQYLSTAKHPKSGSTILVSELMDCSLRSYCSGPDEESLTSECEISLSKDMACGLAYIHSKQIIHRDLCGDNVLLKLTQLLPVAKIADFGMSRLYDPSKLTHTLTAIGHRMGYLPLEAIRLDKEKYDSSLDVFSLGAIMVQIVCRQKTIKSVEDRLFHVSQIPHTHRLRKLINSCLEEDMSSRPSARDICASLARDMDLVEETKMDTQPGNLTEEDSDALEKLLLDNKIEGFALTGERTYEKVVHRLRELGHEELATNIRPNLDKVIGDQKRYLKKLMNEAVTVQSLSVIFVGTPSVGITTTLNRLLPNIENITSDEVQAKPGSTLRRQVVMNKDAICSGNVSEEAKVVFSYMWSQKIDNVPCKEKTTRIEKQSSEEVLSTERHQPKPKKETGTDKLVQIRERLRNGNYSQMASRLGSTLLHIKDVGGQPGLLEMLPAVSNGPALYLVFLDLSKALNEPYNISFSRDDTIITPYRAVHTVEATVSQILSSIASVHHVFQEDDLYKASKLGDKFEKLQQVRPVAALIGTNVDKLENPKEKIKQVNDALKVTTQTFAEILVFPSSDSESSFFIVDNFAGTEQSDVAPIRDFMSKIFASHASPPIKPKWLLLGTLLRMEYSIVSMEDCLKIGRMLEMDEEDTKLCLWYLHSIGSIMYYTNVPDDWLKNHVFCTPEVIFTIVSQLFLAALRILHSKGHVSECEREDLIKLGQLSLEAIVKYCSGPEVTKLLKEGEIISAKQLIILLQHLNLLSEIIHEDANDPNVPRTTYLMPAILDCVKLTNPPPPDTNNAEPLHITFSFGYVPTGVFCGLITRLVSQGPHGILGNTWKLVEDGVKRNCVSFLVAKSNKITLLAHTRCYEFRVVRSLTQISLHDLCTYVLSVILYTLKSLYPKLVPQIAFQCSCPDHQTSGGMDNLCVLAKDFWVQFLCGHKPVTLRKYQKVWLGKHVSLGSGTELEVLKYAKDGFSFCWSKEGPIRQIKTTDDRPNTLSFPSVREEDFGHYQCEVKDAAAGKVLLTLYRALYKEENSNAATQLATDGIPYATIESASTVLTDAVPSDVTEEGDTCLTSYPHTGLRTVTIDEFKKCTKMTDSQLDSEIEETDMINLAAHLDNVDTYAVQLGLSPAEQRDVRIARLANGTQVAMDKALRLWRQHNPGAATYRALVLMLLRMEKKEMAVAVCQSAVTAIPNATYISPDKKQDDLSTPSIPPQTSVSAAKKPVALRKCSYQTIVFVLIIIVSVFVPIFFLKS